MWKKCGTEREKKIMKIFSETIFIVLFIQPFSIINMIISRRDYIQDLINILIYLEYDEYIKKKK